MKPVSIYVHIPFCRKKCGYCDFNSAEISGTAVTGKYAGAVLREIDAYKDKLSGAFIIDTLYFGGGTPSFVDSSIIKRMIDRLSAAIKMSDDAEITIEANPGTVNGTKLESYKTAGINRLSIGAQSFVDAELKLLGRIHDAASIRRTFRAARRSGFRNISLDLIYGLPGQDKKAVLYSLDQMIRLAPEHISVYSLTVEKGTALSRQISMKKIPGPSPDMQAEIFSALIDGLKNAGYDHYEISNFSKPGRGSKHNLAYWTGKDYIGLGAGAHSYLYGKRYSNVKDINKYISGSKRTSQKKLSRYEETREKTVLGLRMLKGVYLSDGSFADQAYADKITGLIDQKLLKLKNERLQLTKKGVLFYDSVAAELI